MTPKQKANHLVDSFRIILMNEDTECGHEILCTTIAIKHAEICVEQMLSSITYNDGYTYTTQHVSIPFKKYWNEVKDELNKL